MPRRTLRVVALLALCAASTLSCTARGSSLDREPVRVRLGLVGTNVPGTGASAVSNLLTTTSLFFRNPSSATPTSAIIERADVSPDGLTYRLRVRQGVHAHDGTLITASTLERTFAGLHTAPRLFPQELVERLRSLDSNTLEIRLRRQSVLFLESLVDLVPVSETVGAGAFLPAAPQEGEATFRRFDRFFLGQPTIDSVVIKEFPTWRTAWGAMLRGEVDGLWETPTDAIDFIEAASEFRNYSSVRRYAYFLGFKVGSPRLGDVRVRRAFAQAIDRERFVKVALRGHGQVATTQLHPEHWAADVTLPALPLDRDRSRSLLEEAGFSKASRGSSGSSHVEPDEIECLVPADDRFERVAQELQRQLSLVGIELRLVPLPVRELIGRLSAGQFETYVLEAAGQSPLYLERFWSPNAPIGVQSGYTAAGAAIDKLRSAGTADEVRTAVRETQAILRDDPPAVFLAYPTVSRVLHRRFVVPPIPEDGSLISQRVLPFVQLQAGSPATAP